MFVWAKNLLQTRMLRWGSSFPERSRLVTRLRREGPSSEVIAEIRDFYHVYRMRYDPHPMGGFGMIPRVSDISRHLSALEDVLEAAFGAGHPGASIRTLEIITDATPSERTPLVLLAFWLLQRGDTQRAHDLARNALTIDSRCLNAQWIVREALKQKSDLVNVSEADVDVCTRDFSDRFCAAPFAELITNPTGDVHTCCPLLLPITIGNVYQDDWHRVWNSPASIEVRRSILDGDFKYCSRLLCQFMRADTLPRRADVTDPVMRNIIDHHKTILDTPPKVANLGHDATCNLSCPQCRNELIVARGSLVQQLKQANTNFVRPLLADLPHVIITNSGDPFASRHYREFMKDIGPTRTPELKTITLLTNGILLTPKEWRNFSNLHHLNVEVIVSVDAASAGTYQSIRRRGDFKRLSENLTFISGLRQAGGISQFHMRFAVQAENFEEMPAFSIWAQELSVDAVVFTQLANCGTYVPAEFHARSVCDVAHPRHGDLLVVLRDRALKWKKVHFDNIEHLYHGAQQLD